jgi:hypothetical protein
MKSNNFSDLDNMLSEFVDTIEIKNEIKTNLIEIEKFQNDTLKIFSKIKEKNLKIERINEILKNINQFKNLKCELNTILNNDLETMISVNFKNNISNFIFKNWNSKIKIKISNFEDKI